MQILEMIVTLRVVDTETGVIQFKMRRYVCVV